MDPKATTRVDPVETTATRVIIADDDAFARRMMRAELQHASITVVADAVNGTEAVELTLYYQPDVVIMDVVMPQTDGLTATRRILEQRPDQVVIMLTGGDEDVGMISLQAGAAGFVTKDVDIEALPRIVRAAALGEAVIPRAMGMPIIQRLRSMSTGHTGLRPIKSPLTAREWEVLDLLCARKSTDEIARALVLSTETVRSHIKSIFRKLHVGRRAEAVAKAQQIRRLNAVA